MKKKVFVIGLSVVLIFFIIFFVFMFYKKNETKTITDAIKFKREYETLNGTEKEGSSNKYLDISISDDNPIKYINCKEMLEVIKKQDAIVYVGAPWCPWCRNAVPVLLEVAKNMNFNTIYYLNLDEEKSLFEISDGKVVETRHGSDDYYKLLSALDEFLTNYTLNDDEGKTFDTKEKRIYNPSVYIVKNGKIVDNYTGTVTLNKNQTAYDKLTEEQHDELYNKYTEMFSKLVDNSCNSEELCN